MTTTHTNVNELWVRTIDVVFLKNMMDDYVLTPEESFLLMRRMSHSGNLTRKIEQNMNELRTRVHAHLSNRPMEAVMPTEVAARFANLLDLLDRVNR